MRLRATDKDVFIAGYLEAQPEWRHAGKIIREHQRREFNFKVTPKYVKSLEAILGKGFADDFEPSDGYGLDDHIGECLHFWEQELLAGPEGLMVQAEQAWGALTAMHGLQACAPTE